MDAGVQSWRLLKLRFLLQALRISGANLSVTKYRSAPIFFDFVDRNAGHTLLSCISYLLTGTPKRIRGKHLSVVVLLYFKSIEQYYYT